MSVFCRDCKHRVPDVMARVFMFGWNCMYDKCGASPRTKDAEAELLVSGKSRKMALRYCTTERSYGPYCGVDGRLFEAKP